MSKNTNAASTEAAAEENTGSEDFTPITSQGVQTRATVQSIKYTLSPEALCRTTLREVQQ